MRLKQEVEYRSSNENINYLDEIYLEWPLDKQYKKKTVVACINCFYPITFEEHILHTFRNEHGTAIGLVVSINRLFKKVSVLEEDLINQWRTEVACSNCGRILSFLNTHKNNNFRRNFTEITQCGNFAEQIVILRTFPLAIDKASKIYNYFLRAQDSMES